MSHLNYREGVFTPTLVGSGTAGTTTYTAQNGNWILVGSLIVIYGRITITAATGTGDAVIGFPTGFNIKNVAGTNPWGTMGVDAATWAWPVGRTSVSLLGLTNTQTGLIACSGTAVGRANMQMTNAAATFNFSMTYQID